MTLSPDNFRFLSPSAIREIEKQTKEEIFYKEKRVHSYQTILSEGRSLGLASRMISTTSPLWEEVHFDPEDKLFKLKGSKRSVTGREIAESFVVDSTKFGSTFYPISGDVRGVGLEQLILFVKDEAQKKYFPYARFKIRSTLKQDKLSEDQAARVSDPTIIFHVNFKSLLEISDPETENLPADYLSNYSAQGIYERAFKGGSANIFVI